MKATVLDQVFQVGYSEMASEEPLLSGLDKASDGEPEKSPGYKPEIPAPIQPIPDVPQPGDPPPGPPPVHDPPPHQPAPNPPTPMEPE